MCDCVKSVVCLLLVIAIMPGTYAQVSYTIDEFEHDSLYFTGFNFGSGSVSTTINTSDFVGDSGSLSISYNFDSGADYFFTTIRNYGTATRDYSFLTSGFSFQYKGGNASSTIAIRFWEDINMNGVFDTTDELYTSARTDAGASDWTESVFSINDLSLEAGNGNGVLDLNRIRAWDIKVQNKNSANHAGTLLVDQFQLISGYAPPDSGNTKLSGSFIQLWNDAGYAYGQWTQKQWNDELEQMQKLCMDKLIVQYSVYGDRSWYSNSNLSFVNVKESTLDKVVSAAENANVKIYFGLYFNEDWNTSDKSQAETYADLLSKQKQVIDEIWNVFATSPAFGGWYIPQEINDLEWQNDPEKTLLFDWLEEISDYAHAKSDLPVIIAPFFNLWQPADVVGTWYESMLSVASNIDAVYPQDGVGITLKDVNYHIPLYYRAIADACAKYGREFGATIESFHQQTGWPVDDGTFSAVSTDINRFKRQLWNAEDAGAVNIVQFSWSYMQSGLTTSSAALNSAYLDYVDCDITSIFDPLGETVVMWPNPASDHIYFGKRFQEVKVFDSKGRIRISALNTDQLSLDGLHSGIYFIQADSSITRIIVQ